MKKATISFFKIKGVLTPHVIFLSILLFYVNFVPQRVELFVANKLSQFPLSILLIILLIYLLILKVTIMARRANTLAERNIIYVLSLLAEFSILSIIANSPINYWYSLLASSYFYGPILMVYYTFMVANSRPKLNYFLKLFICMIIGNISISSLLLFYPEFCPKYMGWESAYQHSYRAVQPVIGGTTPLAFFCVFSMPLLMSILLKAKNKMVYSLLFFLLTSILILTYSRSALLISIMAALTLLIWFSIRKKEGSKLFILLFCLCAIFLCVLYYLVDVEYLLRFGDAPDIARFTSTINGIELIKMKPLLGRGWGTVYLRQYEMNDLNLLWKDFGFYYIDGFESLPSPHNLYILFGVEQGILSPLLIILLFYLMIKKVIVTTNDDGDKILSIGFILSICSVAIFSLVSDILATSYRISMVFWFTIGLGMSHAKLTKDIK